MRKLDPNSCSQWLTDRGVREAPYRSPLVKGGFYLQFALPESETSVSELLASIANAVEPKGDSLVQMCDWSSYGTTFEGPLVRSLRRANNDKNWGWGTGGAVFSIDEMSEALSLCTEVANAGMTAYLYFSDKSTTFLFWEGDLVDCWAGSKKLERRVHKVIKRSGLRLVHRHAC